MVSEKPDKCEQLQLRAPTYEDIQVARDRIAGFAMRTPLIRLNIDGPNDIYLKLELLQPIGSFKVRCAANALLARDALNQQRSIVTASAGNFAQGLGYVARETGHSIKSIVPEMAAEAKLDALRRLGVTIETTPYDRWWSILQNPVSHGLGEEFIHPCADLTVMAGNGTIGLEILEEIHPSLILVPYGGGGLAVGIAAAVKACTSDVRVVAAESEAGTPVAAAFAHGAPIVTPFDSGTFITGMGASRILQPMWPFVKSLLDGAVCASLKSVAEAIRILAVHHHVIAEGAGAVSVAAAMATGRIDGAIVCVVSGGHLDPRHLIRILSGDDPSD